MQINHSLQPLFLDESADGIRRFLADIPLDGTVEVAGFRHLLKHEIARDVQHLRKSVGNQFAEIDILAVPLHFGLRVGNRRGRNEDAVGCDVGCKRNAVAVINAAAVGGDLGLRGDLVNDLLLIAVVLHGLENQNPDQQDGKQTRNGQCENSRAANRQSICRAVGSVLF